MSYYKPDYDGPEKFVEAQEKADEILRLKNQTAPRWLDGENLGTYERRLASRIQPYSPNTKDINLNHATGSAFEVLRNQIYEDALKEAAHPTQFTSKDELREITKYDQSGRPYKEFYGHPSSWMSMFSSGKRRLVGIRTETQKGYVPSN
jgi:hypothetical protein